MEAAESACQPDMLPRHTIGRSDPLTMAQRRDLARFRHVDITEPGMCAGV